MADEEITVQALGVAHQSPAHLARKLRDGLDVLLRHLSCFGSPLKQQNNLPLVVRYPCAT